MPHPTDPAAIELETFTASILLDDHDESGSPSARQTRATARVTPYRTSQGSVDYVIDPTSVVFAGDPGLVDVILASTLFERLSIAAVRRDQSAGSGDGAVGNSYRSTVHVAACVRREGSGLETALTPCGDAFGHRILSIGVSASDGTLITVRSRTGRQCDGGCEPTCAPALVETPRSETPTAPTIAPAAFERARLVKTQPVHYGRSAVAPDGSALSILFNDFVAELTICDVGSEALTTAVLSIPGTFPATSRMTLDVRGFASLDADVGGALAVGIDGVWRETRMEPGSSSDFLLTHEIAAPRTVPMLVQVIARIDARGPESSGCQITVESLDLQFAT